MHLHRKIPIAISITLAIYVMTIMFFPMNEIEIKPDISLITSGVWAEVIAALLLFIVAITNKFVFIGLFMGFTTFLSVSLGRLTGSINDFHIATGYNSYTYGLSVIEILATLGCAISIYFSRKNKLF